MGAFLLFVFLGALGGWGVSWVLIVLVRGCFFFLSFLLFSRLFFIFAFTARSVGINYTMCRV